MVFDDKDQRLVDALARRRVSHDDIALELGIDPRTLRRHFAAELEHAQATMKADLTVALYRRAMKGSVAAIRYFLRLGDDARRAEQRERQRQAMVEQRAKLQKARNWSG